MKTIYALGTFFLSLFLTNTKGHTQEIDKKMFEKLMVKNIKKFFFSLVCENELFFFFFK